LLERREEQSLQWVFRDMPPKNKARKVEDSELESELSTISVPVPKVKRGREGEASISACRASFDNLKRVLQAPAKVHADVVSFSCTADEIFVTVSSPHMDPVDRDVMAYFTAVRDRDSIVWKLRLAGQPEVPPREGKIEGPLDPSFQVTHVTTPGKYCPGEKRGGVPARAADCEILNGWFSACLSFDPHVYTCVSVD
jgi:hypothetical protein